MSLKREQRDKEQDCCIESGQCRSFNLVRVGVCVGFCTLMCAEWRLEHDWL